MLRLSFEQMSMPRYEGGTERSINLCLALIDLMIETHTTKPTDGKEHGRGAPAYKSTPSGLGNNGGNCTGSEHTRPTHNFDRSSTVNEDKMMDINVMGTPAGVFDPGKSVAKSMTSSAPSNVSDTILSNLILTTETLCTPEPQPTTSHPLQDQWHCNKGY